ncbi:MAG: von Willebrand factor type A domain-containing protein [Prevotellaceae bacterium]|jgi:Ca-activated chloride channel family protein|nr:von Willebrand factor type A domain-containing protein [Prevotellaceae bacterium]
MKIIKISKLLVAIAVTFTLLSAVNEAITVTGKITDQSDGTELVGVSITEKDGKNGAISDVNGNYSIKTQVGKTLIFSYSGYKTQEIKVAGAKINVQLEPNETVLEEVSVVGYGTAKRGKGYVGDAHTVRADKIYQAYDVVANYAYMPAPHDYNNQKAEDYSHNSENRFKFAKDVPLSTFSIDVDAASYSNVRRFLNQGQIPPADAVRTEELINYFSYNYEKPTGKEPIKISAEVGECAWNKEHRLVRIALKAKEIPSENLPASNFVFLIDVSGSMWGANRLELVKSSLKLLTNNLREQDRVAIVVYAGSAGEVLPSISGADKQKIREALDKLTAGGSTAGGAGIQLAYKIAENNFIKDGNNRIILCTDGDFNVGVSSNEGLESLIEKERKSGIFLTILGYGMGNYKDSKMQVLAQKGNGNHACIDNLQEANRVLTNEFGATMYAVAKDVKLQIEFNPQHVQAYRLIGYESRLLNDEDFNDDKKDAGEMGAGHSVTAFYEIVPVGVKFTNAGKIDDLKYQKNKKMEEKQIVQSEELLTIKLRYKAPNSDTSEKIELPLIDKGGNNVSSDFRFAAAVAMFGQILISSDFIGKAVFDDVIYLAKTALDNDEQGYRREFIRLAETAKGLQKNN